MLKLLFTMLALLGLVLRGATQFPHTALDSLFSSLSQFGFFHGSVLIGQGDRVVFTRSNGMHNNDSTRYELASLSKVFAAVAVMQMQEQGKIKLQNPVQQYLPEFPYPSVKIEHLLSHTSGLPDFEIFDKLLDAAPERVMTNEAILPVLKNGVKLLFEPGDKWSYSSPGIALLALIVERQSGMGFEAYLQKYIFKPAGMRHTYISRFNAPVRDGNRALPLMYPTYYASTLVTADTVARNQRFLHASGGVVGPGLVVSTAPDLFAFDRALMTGKLLRTATLAKMFTPVKLNNGKPATCPHYPGTVNFGLGWFLLQDSQLGKMVFHSGFKNGTSTILLQRLSTGTSVILLDNGNSAGISASAFNCLRLLHRLPMERLKTPVTFPYGRDIVTRGANTALLNFMDNREDTAHYTMGAIDWVAMGYEFFRTGKFEESFETFRTGYLLYPNDALLCQVYGDVLLETGKKKEALHVYKKALHFKPDNKELKDKVTALISQL
ncbi:serine hydrolase domain-containing protein [Niabella beijingensis]|uniref:serine hydrolase domain-containing protein n=1 Tax=Niabella beijingensis TaxID=2872700 RepID=UPI001CBA8253|nr:serine hydrolase domain-containing protein [Niabella beijingensis]MBZ4192667.1 serine hydrolase [Niabella beijingensis]